MWEEDEVVVLDEDLYTYLHERFAYDVELTIAEIRDKDPYWHLQSEARPLEEGWDQVLSQYILQKFDLNPDRFASIEIISAQEWIKQIFDNE